MTSLETGTTEINMVFSNKDLILVSPYSPRTYYRRIKSLKDKSLFEKKTDGALLTLNDALQIAEALGFKKEFEKFLSDHGKH